MAVQPLAVLIVQGKDALHCALSDGVTGVWEYFSDCNREEVINL